MNRAHRNTLLIVLVYAILILLSACQTRGARDLHEQNLWQDFPLNSAEIRQAQLIRTLLDSMAGHHDDGNLAGRLKLEVARHVSSEDSLLKNRLLEKLTADSSFIRQCEYVFDLKQNWQSVPSAHFIFYFRDGNKPSTVMMQTWDNDFRRLSETFKTHIPVRIPYKIDKDDRYGRCFPPWEVRWGIKSRDVTGNTHELVHLMLFKYSDVPFFHEPLAFIYGTYKGNRDSVQVAWLPYEQMIADSGYVSATQLLHFPQIIGLDRVKRASACYFIRCVADEFGIDKLLQLMKAVPWAASEDDLITSFQRIYNIRLSDYEREIVSRIAARSNRDISE